MSARLFDAKQVRRAFSRSAAGYDAAARLQHAVEARLLESLDYLDDPALKREAPRRVLDLGCGTGRASLAMQKRWPKAQVVSLDLALPMLQRGLLRRVLPDWCLPPHPAWAVFPGRKLMPAKTRVFIDMLQAALAGSAA